MKERNRCPPPDGPGGSEYSCLNLNLNLDLVLVLVLVLVLNRA